MVFFLTPCTFPTKPCACPTKSCNFPNPFPLLGHQPCQNPISFPQDSHSTLHFSHSNPTFGESLNFKNTSCYIGGNAAQFLILFFFGCVLISPYISHSHFWGLAPLTPSLGGAPDPFARLYVQLSWVALFHANFPGFPTP